MQKPNKLVFAEERKQAIVERIELGALTVSELTEIFDVSPTTIRNDLRELEQQGLLVRTHGGAMPRQKTGAETALEQRQIENIEAKKLIAQAALGCVEDGDTLILDVGTTTYELARLLGKHHRVRVVTNDLQIALLADEYPNLDIFMLEGKIRSGYHCVIGAAAVRSLSAFTADYAFLGTNGFDIEFGASTPDTEQAEMKRAIIRSSSKNYLLCDSSKFGRRSFTRFARFEEVDAVITDNIAESDIRSLEERGLEVIAAVVL
ncbi:MAG: DeoR/GlpR family DNA-binding transcription regulator [Chloroflexota bacterium]